MQSTAASLLQNVTGQSAVESHQARVQSTASRTARPLLSLPVVIFVPTSLSHPWPPATSPCLQPAVPEA